MKKFHKIKLIFGLGNPEIKFKNTPHNFGRDLVVAHLNTRKELNYSYLGKYKNIYLAVGKLYMNESGKVLKELIEILKIKPENVLLIHDEADLNFLRVKISFNGSPSMHKGVESIYKICGNNIWRMRLGIQFFKKRVKAEKIILKKLPKDLLKEFSKAKKKFELILEKLNKLPIEKLNLPRDFFINSQSL